MKVSSSGDVASFEEKVACSVVWQTSAYLRGLRGNKIVVGMVKKNKRDRYRKRYLCEAEIIFPTSKNIYIYNDPTPLQRRRVLSQQSHRYF
jgi:hypothetical protein